MPRPGIVGMRGSMVIRLRLCMIVRHPSYRVYPPWGQHEKNDGTPRGGTYVYMNIRYSITPHSVFGSFPHDSRKFGPGSAWRTPKAQIFGSLGSAPQNSARSYGDLLESLRIGSLARNVIRFLLCSLASYFLSPGMILCNMFTYVCTAAAFTLA